RSPRARLRSGRRGPSPRRPERDRRRGTSAWPRRRRGGRAGALRRAARSAGGPPPPPAPPPPPRRPAGAARRPPGGGPPPRAAAESKPGGGEGGVRPEFRPEGDEAARGGLLPLDRIAEILANLGVQGRPPVDAHVRRQARPTLYKQEGTLPPRSQSACVRSRRR